MSAWKSVCAAISEATGEAFIPGQQQAVGGGSINEAWVLTSVERRYFVKLNRPDLLEMFVAEAEGLAEIRESASLRAPVAVCYGSDAHASFIVLEYFQQGSGGAGAHALLGQELAVMHRQTKARFGWHRDNTIGATPQRNGWQHDWLCFLREQRLGYQLELAARNGASRQLHKQAQRLLAGLEYFFRDYEPLPSLLHGDLWSGNYSFDEQGKPIIFDPAVYYGDREADIAMTELFGGFGSEFYAGYEQAWPLDAGYAQRKTLYNLYHIINHFNLFGGGYEGQAISMIERLNRLLP